MRGTFFKTETLLVLAAAGYLIALAAVSGGQVRLARSAPVTVETQMTAAASEIAPADGYLDINTATAEELEQLPGIGEKLAARIVEYRAEHGPFTQVEDLMNVSGIGEGKLAAIAGEITAGGNDKGA